MDKKLGILLGFAVGCAIGYNWPRIYLWMKFGSQTIADAVADVAGGAVRYAAEVKERVEDAGAEAQHSKQVKEQAAAAAGTGNGFSDMGADGLKAQMQNPEVKVGVPPV